MLKKINDQLRNCIAVVGAWKGFLLVSYFILYRIFRFYPSLSFFFLDKKHKIVINYLHELKRKSNNYTLRPKKEVDPQTIWIFWWQGEANMPDIVKACISSVKKHAGVFKVQLITKENIIEYLDIPILSKVGSSITLINFSDYVRLSLLTIYGGGWIDATIYLTKDIPVNIANKDFYTIRHTRKKFFCISDYRWGVSFLFVKKGNPLISYVYNLFANYWEQNDSLIDYFLIDYCFAYAVENDEICRRVLESVPYNNPQAYNGIVDKFLQPFDKTLYDEITRETWVHKLSYKVPYRSDKERPTFYNYVINNTL